MLVTKLKVPVVALDHCQIPNISKAWANLFINLAGLFSGRLLLEGVLFQNRLRLTIKTA